jgi:hypothetical protein
MCTEIEFLGDNISKGGKYILKISMSRVNIEVEG